MCTVPFIEALAALSVGLSQKNYKTTNRRERRELFTRNDHYGDCVANAPHGTLDIQICMVNAYVYLCTPCVSAPSCIWDVRRAYRFPATDIFSRAPHKSLGKLRAIAR